MILPDYDVTTIYASNPDPEGLEYGFEIKTARAGSGLIESVAILDHTEGELMEAPVEVVLLFAQTLQALQARPLAPAGESETVVFASRDVPGLDQDGYEIVIERGADDAVEAVILVDLKEDVEIVCDPETAYAMAAAMASLVAFPRHLVN